MKNLLYILIQLDPDDPSLHNIHFIADSKNKCKAKAIALFKEWTGTRASWNEIKDEFEIQDINRGRIEQVNIKDLTDEMSEELNALERKIVAQYFDKNDINFLDIAETFLEPKHRDRYFKLRKKEDPDLEI